MFGWLAAGGPDAGRWQGSSGAWQVFTRVDTHGLDPEMELRTAARRYRNLVRSWENRREPRLEAPLGLLPRLDDQLGGHFGGLVPLLKRAE